ncbi:hypothetical protein P9112_012708 [Eukaryota sp. TZLM1-RC]
MQLQSPLVIWNKSFDPFILSILNKETPVCCFRDIHRYVHIGHLSSRNVNLHDFVSYRLYKFSQATQMELLTFYREQDILPTLASKWQDLQDPIHYISCVFEMVGVRREHCVIPVVTGLIGSSLDSPLLGKIKEGIQTRLDSIHNGQVVSDSSLASIVSFLLSVPNEQIFGDIFEKPYLSFLTDYYRECARDDYNQLPIGDYLLNIPRAMERECAFCRDNLLKRMIQPIENIVKTNLFDDYFDLLVTNGVRKWLLSPQENGQLLQCFYSLVRANVQQFNRLLNEFPNCLKNQLNLIKIPDHQCKDRSKIGVCVIQVIKIFKDLIEYLLPNCFENNQTMINDFHLIFKDFFNRNNFHWILLRRLDNLLSLDPGTVQDALFNTETDDIISFIMYLDNKDSFFIPFTKLFVNRIVTPCSYKDAAICREKLVLGKLKAKFGMEFEREQYVLRSFETSRDVSVGFMNSTSIETCPIRKIDVQLYSHSQLGEELKGIPCKIPSVFMTTFNCFADYYKHTRSSGSGAFFSEGVWDVVTNKSTCVLNFIPNSGIIYEVHCSMIQAMILLVLNDYVYPDRITIGELQVNLGLSFSVLSKSLSPMLVKPDSRFPQPVVLYKSNPKQAGKPKIRAQDEVVINLQFSGRVRSFRLNSNIKDESEEVSAAEKSLLETRKQVTDAAIVRVLKRDREIDVSTLVHEVQCFVAHLFIPSHAFIKERIDTLIDREYCERVQGSQGLARVYRYIA